MHKHSSEFFKGHLDKIKGETIDVGALNVNGALHTHVPVTVRVDMREGRDVDTVCKGEDLPTVFGREHFDTVLTADTLEHVEDWRGFLVGCWDSLKIGGWFIGTLAARTKGRHAHPNDYWRATPEILIDLFPGAKAGDLVPQPSAKNPTKAVRVLSTFWCVQKTVENQGCLKDIETKHLIPIDDKVPASLLEGNPHPPVSPVKKKR